MQPAKQVMITPAKNEELTWFEIKNCPMLDAEVDISFKEDHIIFTNRTKTLLCVNGKQILPDETITVEI